MGPRARADYFARQFRTRRSDDNPHAETPLHYLEKIFQIPLALKPVPSGGFTRMIESMVGKAAPARPPSVSASTLPAPGATSARSDGETAAPRVTAPSRLLPTATPPASPRNLVLDSDEIQRLIIASDLMNSPRTAKRFVNLYRIVRAGVTDSELDDFATHHAGPIQLCLAIVVGKPSLASELFTAIFDLRCTDHAALVAFVRAHAEPTNAGAFMLPGGTLRQDG